MSPTATATIAPQESAIHEPAPLSRRVVESYGRDGRSVRHLQEFSGEYVERDSSDSVATPMDSGLNAAWAGIVQSVTNRSSGGAASKIVTVDLAEGESAREFCTRLRMLLLFMKRDEDSISATVSPSFRDDTYPAMLALVKAFQISGASDDWRPDGPRSIRMGNAKHLFVSVDMPIADRSASPDTLIEIVDAHKVSASWYDQRVRPRASASGLTTVMFGLPSAVGSADSSYADSVFKRERAVNLSGRPGGFHFSRIPHQVNWSAPAAV